MDGGELTACDVDRSRSFLHSSFDSHRRAIDALDSSLRPIVRREPQELSPYRYNEDPHLATTPAFLASIPEAGGFIAADRARRRPRRIDHPTRAEFPGSTSELRPCCWSAHPSPVGDYPTSPLHRAISDQIQGEFELTPNFSYFDGESCDEDYLEWEQEVDDFFYYACVPREKQVRCVVHKLKGRAKTWWALMLQARHLEGRSEVRTWHKMKQLLRGQFLTSDYEMLSNEILKKSSGIAEMTEKYNDNSEAKVEPISIEIREDSEAKLDLAHTQFDEKIESLEGEVEAKNFSRFPSESFFSNSLLRGSQLGSSCSNFAPKTWVQSGTGRFSPTSWANSGDAKMTVGRLNLKQQSGARNCETASITPRVPGIPQPLQNGWKWGVGGVSAVKPQNNENISASSIIDPMIQPLLLMPESAESDAANMEEQEFLNAGTPEQISSVNEDVGSVDQESELLVNIGSDFLTQEHSGDDAVGKEIRKVDFSNCGVHVLPANLYLGEKMKVVVASIIFRGVIDIKERSIHLTFSRKPGWLDVCIYEKQSGGLHSPKECSEINTTQDWEHTMLQDTMGRELKELHKRLEQKEAEMKRPGGFETIALKQHFGKELLQLRKEVRINEYERHKLQALNQRQKMVLQRKTEEAAMATKKLKELFEARKSSAKDISVLSNGSPPGSQMNEKTFQRWLDHELEAMVNVHEVCIEYEKQSQVLAALAEEIDMFKEDEKNGQSRVSSKKINLNFVARSPLSTLDFGSNLFIGFGLVFIMFGLDGGGRHTSSVVYICNDNLARVYGNEDERFEIQGGNLDGGLIMDFTVDELKSLKLKHHYEFSDQQNTGRVMRTKQTFGAMPMKSGAPKLDERDFPPKPGWCSVIDFVTRL